NSVQGDPVKPIRVCVMSMKSVPLSTRGIPDREFCERIKEVSEGRIDVSFLKIKPTGRSKVENLAKVFSFMALFFKRYRYLRRQDILVSDDIGIPGFLICLFSRITRRKTMLT